jgi:hypothetical protein
MSDDEAPELIWDGDGCQDAIAEAVLAERERCIAAMVASQPEGMRAVMEQRYREIMEAGK